MEDFKQFCLDHYSPSFHESHISCAEFKYQENFGRIICELFKVESVIDFGCGVAKSLLGAYRTGAKVKGIEITLEHAGPFIHKDIRQFVTDENAALAGFDVSTKYDCAWSFEVAEHLEPATSQQFIHNICQVTKKLIVFTAAPPGQGGVGHINCQEHSFWKGLFLESGFIYDVEKTHHLLAHTTHLKLPWYIVRNLMIFSC